MFQRFSVAMSFTLPKLPYEAKELEPHTSATTLSFHHGKSSIPVHLSIRCNSTPSLDHHLTHIDPHYSLVI